MWGWQAEDPLLEGKTVAGNYQEHSNILAHRFSPQYIQQGLQLLVGFNKYNPQSLRTGLEHFFLESYRFGRSRETLALEVHPTGDAELMVRLPCPISQPAYELCTRNHELSQSLMHFFMGSACERATAAGAQEENARSELY
jgi:hypothetical protein